MIRKYVPMFVGFVAALSVLVSSHTAQAHEPVFSPGPRTIYEDGVATAMTAESSFDGGRDGPIRLSGDVAYGLTSHLQFALGVPVLVGRQADHGPSTAVGDSVFQVKWRAWDHMARRLIDSFSLLTAVKLPTGHHETSIGNTGFTLGAMMAREHRRYYLFGSALYTTQTAGVGGRRPGDVFQYNLATGIRPFLLEYDQPDAVVLVGLNGTTTRPAQVVGAASEKQTLRRGLSEQREYRTVRQANGGGAVDFGAAGGAAGTELAVSPQLLFSWGPVMLKGGVQFPFFDTFEAEGATPNFRIKSSLIVEY
ncbi:MAG: hypothetical protein ABEN55_12890 [Bradymonadaceae bacterium]